MPGYAELLPICEEDVARPSPRFATTKEEQRHRVSATGKRLVLLSGGLDSAVLLYEMVHVYGNEGVEAISFEYGQHHAVELECAKFLARRVEVAHHIVNVRDVFRSVDTPLLTGWGIPKKEYREQERSASGAVPTYVPNRNMLFLAVAGVRAMARGIGTICIAVHKGDAEGNAYPDTTVEFMDGMIAAFGAQRLAVGRPFILMDKADVVQLGWQRNVPFEHTWSCYDPRGTEPCGRCGTCREREWAFEKMQRAQPETDIRTVLESNAESMGATLAAYMSSIDPSPSRTRVFNSAALHGA